MKTATFNNLIKLSYPDDFVELSLEENEKYFSGDLMRLSFQNKDKHILLSLSKSKDSFINRILNVASIVATTLSTLENNLKDYQHLGEYESEVFDRASITECFSYMASDENVKQYAEMTVFKEKKAFYIIYCISRYEDKEESKKLFKEFRESFLDID